MQLASRVFQRIRDILAIIGLIGIIMYFLNDPNSQLGVWKPDSSPPYGDTHTQQEQPAPSNPVELLSIRTRVTNRTSLFWRYAYVAELQNNTDRRQVFPVSVQWLDSDGFVVYGLYEPEVIVEPRRVDTLRGWWDMFLPEAEDVRSITVEFLSP